MKVLVTGGTGFIGRYLVDELLHHGYDVKILSRRGGKQPSVIKGDITDIESIEKAVRDVDVVFHNAALAMDRGRKSVFYKVNVEGTRNIAEVCAKKSIRVIYTSSAGVYGFPNTLEPIREDSPKRPLNAYQRSKLEGERILRQYGLNVSIARPPLVLGAGSFATEFIISSIKKGNFLYVGDGNNYISIAHPKDVAKCLRLILEKDKDGDIFNIVSFSCRIRELVETIAKRLGVREPRRSIPYGIAYTVALLSELLALLGKEPKLTRFRVKSLGTNRIVSCEKARSKLGFVPDFNLDKTVEDMVSWYESMIEKKT